MTFLWGFKPLITDGSGLFESFQQLLFYCRITGIPAKKNPDPDLQFIENDDFHFTFAFRGNLCQRKKLKQRVF